MADLSKFETEPRTQLLEELKGVRCVMLGARAYSEHMQPMAPQIDKQTIETAEQGGGPRSISFPTICPTWAKPS